MAVSPDLLVVADILIQKAYTAFSVQLLGPQFVGISEFQARLLVMDRLLSDDESKRGVTLPGTDIDLFQFAVLMGSISAEEAFAETELYKSLLGSIKQGAQSIAKWTKHVIQRIVGRPKKPTSVPGAPEYLTETEARAWLAAKQRAADLLTNASTELKADVRALVAEAIEKQWSWQELEQVLSARFAESKRKWATVARTELQMAFNEGVAAHAEDAYGDSARIAFLPEPDACDTCKSLFLDKNGKPKVFLVSQLRENGSNVGRKKADKVPTIGPPHPNCRCRPVSLPPGKSLDKVLHNLSKASMVVAAQLMEVSNG